jgi:predicted dithiol-disulfide oxidoreductase (DUF899 family)
VKLSELFSGRGQLIIVHFMYGPDWEEGCKSCPFWADQYDGIIPHLGGRDVSLAVISIARVQASLVLALPLPNPVQVRILKARA